MYRSKNTLRVSSAILVALIFVAVLAGCGSNSSHAASSATTTTVPPHLVARGTAADPPLKIYSTGQENVIGYRGSSKYTGGLSGGTTYHGISIYDPVTKTFKSEQVETFSGTLGSVGHGTLTFDNLTDTAADGSIKITGTVIRSSGDLAKVHGTIHFVGTTDGSTYRFDYRLDT